MDNLPLGYSSFVLTLGKTVRNQDYCVKRKNKWSTDRTDSFRDNPLYPLNPCSIVVEKKIDFLKDACYLKSQSFILLDDSYEPAQEDIG